MGFRKAVNKHMNQKLATTSMAILLCAALACTPRTIVTVQTAGAN